MDNMKMIVVVFDSESLADAGAHALEQLHARGEITLYALDVIVKDADGKMALKQVRDRDPIGTGVGALAGALLGLFGGPAGIALGASGGALAGSLHDLSSIDVDEDFLSEVKRLLQAGKAAVVAEVWEEWALPIDTRMEAAGGMVLRWTRREVRTDHIENELAAFKAELAELKAEYARSSGEAKARIRARIDMAQARLQATQEHTRAALETAKQERDAKIHSLEEQAAQARNDAKSKIKARLTQVRSEYKQRIDKLHQAWEHSRQMQAVCDAATNQVASEQLSATRDVLAGHQKRLKGKLKVAAGEIEQSYGRVTGQPDKQAAGLRKQAEGEEEEASAEALLNAAQKADGRAF